MSRIPPTERLGLLRRPTPRPFELWVAVVPARGARTIDEADWRDALVEVEQGEIELELTSDDRVHFTSGDVLWLHGLGVRTLRNRGPRLAVLVGIRRRPR